MGRQSRHRAVRRPAYNRSPARHRMPHLASPLKRNRVLRTQRVESDDLYSGDDEDGDEDDNLNDLFEWEEETTLVAELMKEDPTDDKLASIVNELKVPMSAQSQHLKKYFAQVLVPTANLVREAHARVEHVDVAFGKGILTFDQSCKTMERVVVTGRNALLPAYRKLQENERRLLHELAQAYSRRDQLWVDLESSINKLADLALSRLKEVPISIERMIAAVERQSKELDKDTTDSTKADKLIKELFEKLA